MKRGAAMWSGLLLAALMTLPPLAHAGLEPLPFEDQTQAVRYQRLLAELRCTVCQNESLAESKAELARDMRLRIFEMMREGKSDQEIRDFLVARYGDFVLYRPPFQRNTWVLWLAPGAIVLLGASALALVVRRRARGLAPDEDGVEDER